MAQHYQKVSLGSKDKGSPTAVNVPPSPDLHGVRQEAVSTHLDVLYSVNDVPPWYLCIFLGLQHFLTAFGGSVSLPLALAPYICLHDYTIVGYLINTGMFVYGLATLLQTTVGTRLPIVQGGPFTFLIPAFALLSTQEWQCPHVADNRTTFLDNDTATEDLSINTTFVVDATGGEDAWKLRINHIQGAILLASLIQLILGATGLVGKLLQYIGPLVIAPTITLIGLTLFKIAPSFCEGNWPVACMTIFFIVLFSQYVHNIEIPCCSYSRSGGCRKRSYPFFKLFPIISAIVISWVVCAVLTASGSLSNEPSHWTYKARTDAKADVLVKAEWLRLPYPCQWGLPTFSIAGVFGMISAVLAGIVESIGDYYACARLSGASPPPVHAINRGILVEGIGCVMCALWGTGSGVTSFSENVGAIGITKVGSRRVVMFSALIMIVFGVLGKFGALFATIPDPIVGGVFMCMFGMVCAVGISNLQLVDMNSSRNLFVFGFSLFFGHSVSEWITQPRNADVLNTGNQTVDQVVFVLLSTSMFLGGTMACILDNTIPGTLEERGLAEWRRHLYAKADTSDTQTIGLDPQHDGDSATVDKTYDIPVLTGFLKKHPCFSRVPISPTFIGYGCKPCN